MADPSPEPSSLCCSFCSFLTTKWRLFLRHTFECHSSLPNFLFKCPLAGCVQTFRKLTTFNSHLSRKHAGQCVFNADLSYNHNLQGDGDDNETMDSQEVEQDFTTAAIASDGLPAEGQLMAKKSAALFLLTMKERHCLTQVALNFAVDQVRGMVSYIIHDLKSKLTEKLEGVDVDVTGYFDCTDPFVDLGTEYLQHKFYQQHFGLIVCLIVNNTCKFYLFILLGSYYN